MRNPHENDVFTQPNQYPATLTPPPVKPGSPGSRLRAGAILALTLMFAVVFGTGLFAGWEFASRNGTNTAVLQPCTNPGTALPKLDGGNLEAVREAVVTKVRPAVVQVNVATSCGQGLGSGVIFDQRGYIITNHHVIDGAQQIQIVLSDGTALPAQLVGASSPDDLAVVKVTPPRGNLASVLRSFPNGSRLLRHSSLRLAESRIRVGPLWG
jgi:S1-C subfamily serine protease